MSSIPWSMGSRLTRLAGGGPVDRRRYGDCEFDAAASGSTEGKYGYYSSYDTYLAEAAGQGQTIVVARVTRERVAPRTTRATPLP